MDRIDQIVEAHRPMGDARVAGKIVVLTWCGNLRPGFRRPPVWRARAGVTGNITARRPLLMDDSHTSAHVVLAGKPVPG
jgi:hypothetical protein